MTATARAGTLDAIARGIARATAKRPLTGAPSRELRSVGTTKNPRRSNLVAETTSVRSAIGRRAYDVRDHRAPDLRASAPRISSAKERAALLRRVRRGLLGRRVARCAFPSVAVLLGVGLPILIDSSDESFGPIGIAAAVAVAALLLASSVGAILELVLGRSSGRAILAVATAALLIGLASNVHALTGLGVAALGLGGATALFVRWRRARGVNLTAALVDAEAGEVHCFRPTRSSQPRFSRVPDSP